MSSPVRMYMLTLTLCIYFLSDRMGSVLAASSPNPPPPASGGVAAAPGLTVPPGFGMPPVSSVIPPDGAASEQEAENSLSNPGAFDECHRKCKGNFRVWRVIWVEALEGRVLLLIIIHLVFYNSIPALPDFANRCVFLYLHVFPLRGVPDADGGRPASCQ